MLILQASTALALAIAGGAAGEAQRQVPEYSQALLPAQIIITGDEVEEPASPEAVRAAVEQVSNDNEAFLILARGDQYYMQCAWVETGFILELREGSAATHVAAYRKSGSFVQGGVEFAPDRLTPQEVMVAMAAYLDGRTEIPGLGWTPLSL